MSGHWRRHAACLDSDPDLFFPDGHGTLAAQQEAEALAVCATCPVTVECLDLATRLGVRDGVWGGVSQSRRVAALRAQRRTDPSLRERRALMPDHRWAAPILAALDAEMAAGASSRELADRVGVTHRRLCELLQTRPEQMRRQTADPVARALGIEVCV